MDYPALLKEAWQLTRRHIFLWIFGLFAGTAGAFPGFGGVNLPDFGQGPEKLKPEQLQQFLDQYGSLISIGLTIFIFLVIALALVSIFAQGAIVTAVDRLAAGNRVGFADAFRAGAPPFLRLFGLRLLVVLFFLFLIALGIAFIALPVSFEATGLIVFGSVLGILLLFLLIILAFAAAIALPYAERALILDRLGIRAAISEAIRLFRHHFLTILIIALILFALSLAFGFVVLLAMLTLGGIGVGAVVLVTTIDKAAAWVVGIPFALAFLALLLVTQAAFSTYTSSVVTLAYRHLRGASGG